MDASDYDVAAVSSRGAARWTRGHPWIFRSDVVAPPPSPGIARAVLVREGKHAPLGVALWSPKSEIALRLLDRNPRARIDEGWWRSRIRAAVDRREDIARGTNALRLVHAEGDALPSLICDRYDKWLVVQLSSAGLEHYRADIVAALLDLTSAAGILARHDTSVRTREGLVRTTELLHGSVPETIEVDEHGIRYLAAPYSGQKTGAFLDQRENRRLVRGIAKGRVLDCFSYHGSFALHAAATAERVIAVDSSRDALARAAENARLNAIANIEFVEADVAEYLREQERSRERYDTIVLDPPAFAKTKSTVAAALRGYKEINLRAMRLLSPGGILFTASCSYHVTKDVFWQMLGLAAADSGRPIALRALLGQPGDHPEVLTIPETGYLKAALVEALA